MHEYSIAYDLYATARTAAREHGATKVKKVTVEVGKMAIVNPEQVAAGVEAKTQSRWGWGVLGPVYPG